MNTKELTKLLNERNVPCTVCGGTQHGVLEPDNAGTVGIVVKSTELGVVGKMLTTVVCLTCRHVRLFDLDE